MDSDDLGGQRRRAWTTTSGASCSPTAASCSSERASGRLRSPCRRRSWRRRRWAPLRRARRRQLRPAASEVEVRVRQPRDDEPVLRPDALRGRGRVLSARLQLPVDGIEDIRHQRDGQRVQRRDHGEGGRHRGRAGLPDGLQRPDEPSARQGHPGSRLQRGCSEQPPLVHRPGSLPVRLRHGPAGRRAGPEWRRRTLHRYAGPAQHPAAHRRPPGGDQEVRQGQDQDERHRHRCAPARRAGEGGGLLPRAQRREGHVRGRRRHDRGHRSGDEEVRPPQEGGQGGWLRPEPEYSQVGQCR